MRAEQSQQRATGGRLRRIVSGGQTGVDRAALEVARRMGLEHGGWCPRGRLAEDGEIPACYELQETDSPEYSVRTERNVVDSDGTLILGEGELHGGTLLTLRLAERHRKPVFVVDLAAEPRPEEIREWLVRQQLEVLNVAGPRESSSPGIRERAERLLDQVFRTERDRA